MQARSLRIELALGPLMRGELRATEMRLVSPQFNIGLDGQGQIDWPSLSLANETLSIDRLSIEDGRATLSDPASKSKLELEQFWFRGDVRSLTGPIRGKGEFVTGGRLYGYDISAGAGDRRWHAAEAQPQERRAPAHHGRRGAAGARSRQRRASTARSPCRGRPARRWQTARPWRSSRGG